jgi:hypothetical protein
MDLMAVSSLGLSGPAGLSASLILSPAEGSLFCSHPETKSLLKKVLVSPQANLYKHFVTKLSVTVDNKVEVTDEIE